MCCHNFSCYFLAGAFMSCLTLVNLASTQLICFTFKLWTNFSPCFKASPLDWKSVESCYFKSSNQLTFNFSTIPLCSLIDQFSFLLTGLNWYPGMEVPLALSEQPSTPRKVFSFACKITNCLDRSAINVAFGIIAHFGMSGLFHETHVVMRSFPAGLTI